MLATLASTAPVAGPFLALAVGVIFVILAIARWKMHAFFALMLAAMLVGLVIAVGGAFGVMLREAGLAGAVPTLADGRSINCSRRFSEPVTARYFDFAFPARNPADYRREAIRSVQLPFCLGWVGRQAHSQPLSVARSTARLGSAPALGILV